MSLPAVGVVADRLHGAVAKLAGFTLGFVLPLAMVYANKSTPAVLGVALVLSAFALPAAGWSAVGGTLRRWSGSPVGWCAAAFTLWALVSIGWSVSPQASLTAFGQAVAPVLIGLALVCIFPRIAMLDLLRFLLFGLIVAGFLIVADLNTDLMVRRLLGVRAETFAFNRSVVTLTLLFWPLLAGLAPGARTMIGPALFCGMVAVVASSESGTSVMALAAAAGAYAIGLLLPRLAQALCALGALAAFAVAPFAGPLFAGGLTDNMNKALSSTHSIERIHIWTAYGDLVRQVWPRGTGFASSAFIQSDPAAAAVPAALRPDLGWGHPHNIFLQIWVELGIVGVVLAAAGLTLALWWGLRPGARHVAFKTAFAASSLAIAFVSHGAWQAWWLALLAACIAWFMVAESREPHMQG